METCLFCDWKNTEKHKMIIENDLFYSRYDNFPISKGHAEIVPKKHIVSFFDLTKEEIEVLFDLLMKTKKLLDEQFHPDAYNLGVNDGMAAGRTVHHLHIHIIPRYNGDVPNPKGGIRHIIPEKGFY